MNWIERMKREGATPAEICAEAGRINATTRADEGDQHALALAEARANPIRGHGKFIWGPPDHEREDYSGATVTLN